MAGGQAHGQNRQYQVECRDVLISRRPELKPWAGDGIDIPFDATETHWVIDVALRDKEGKLVAAECRRTVGAVKQEAVAAFAFKIESIREALNIDVAGLFIAKREHQIGAIKVAQFVGIQTVILEEGATPPGFNITFLRYDKERKQRCLDYLMSIPPGSLELVGYPATLVHGNSSGESDSR